MHIPKGIVRYLHMDDYTQHPMWGFSQNHPERPDVLDEEPLTLDLLDRAFDGEVLSFQYRAMLCVSAICDENEKDYFFRIEREALNTIITNWSLDKLDRWHLQEDVMLLAEPVIMDGGE